MTLKVESGDFFEGEPGGLAELVVLKAKYVRRQAYLIGGRHIGAPVAVRVRDEQVLAAVDADDASDDPLGSEFLADLSDERIRGLFAGLEATAHESPAIAPLRAGEEHASGTIADHRGDRREEQKIVANAFA
ncbi:hypothetical protein GCM10010922_01830 [Microbacterium sorbitolivorans]|nr:hypothetical protein GCM10010922_01830 [Microbacterium sorbitolivorans]